MAGGGQMRPQGSAMADARASGITGIASGNGAAQPLTLSFNNNSPMQGSVAGIPMSPNIVAQGGGARIPMSSGGVAGVDFPRRGEEGSFYGQQAQPFTPSIAPQGNFNVNQAAAGGLQQAMQGTQAAMNYAPMAVRPTAYNSANTGQSPTVAAQNVQAGQLANTNLGAYTNPFETQVVDQALGDLERSRLMAQNQLGAQATSANAFGGSRQGIAEAETNRAFADQAARTASGLRQAGYTQAQQMAMQDIGTAQQAALANQQANLAAGTTTAGFGQQSNLANQAAQNQANQFGATQAMSAQLANQAGLAGANQQNLASAAQMGNLANQAFGTGQAVQQQQGQAGLLQQSMQQALIDAAKAQYAGYQGAPLAALSAPIAALQNTPNQSTTTDSMKPGLFNYLQVGANMYGNR
jgi:hypothetical protein